MEIKVCRVRVRPCIPVKWEKRGQLDLARVWKQRSISRSMLLIGHTVSKDRGQNVVAYPYGPYNQQNGAKCGIISIYVLKCVPSSNPSPLPVILVLTGIKSAADPENSDCCKKNLHLTMFDTQFNYSNQWLINWWPMSSSIFKNL